MRTVMIAAAMLWLALPTAARAPQVVGAWTLNRELSTLPPTNDRDGAEGRRPRGPGGRGPGGGGGRGGFGGGFGGRGMPGMGGQGPNEDQMRRMEVIRRRMREVPERLLIVQSGQDVSFTDGEGRTFTLKADGKKQDRLTGDGEFKSKTHFDGASLVIEEDFGGGVKLTTTYAPALDGDHERLEVSLKPEGLRGPGGGGDSGRGGGPSGFKRVYDLVARSPAS